MNAQQQQLSLDIARPKSAIEKRLDAALAALETIVASNSLQHACTTAEEALEADEKASKGKP